MTWTLYVYDEEGALLGKATRDGPRNYGFEQVAEGELADRVGKHLGLSSRVTDNFLNDDTEFTTTQHPVDIAPLITDLEHLEHAQENVERVPVTTELVDE